MKAGAEKLVYMANQIATAFRTQKHDAAVLATFDHLMRFWDPQMRRALLVFVERGGEGLNDIARSAVRRLQAGAAASQADAGAAPAPGRAT